MKHRILLVSDMHYTTDFSEKELRLTHPESRASLASGPLFGRTQKEKIDLISAAVVEEHAKAPLDAVLVLGDLSIDDYDYRKLPDNYCVRLRAAVLGQDRGSRVCDARHLPQSPRARCLGSGVYTG